MEKKFAKDEEDLLALELAWALFFREEDKVLASIFCFETTNLDSIWLEETVGEDN